MTDLQSRAIDLKRRPFSNIFSSDRLVIVKDGCSIHGTSLVARTPFRRGELILPLTGTLSSRSYRTIQIDVRRHLDDALMAFMNHSCRPTSIVQAQALGVRTAVDLKEGDEITFFYPSTEWDMVRPFECLCGARECIGFIAGAQHLSIEILRRYFINAHIQKLAAEAFLPVSLGEHIR
jgi:SET domain-containing protein